MDEKEQIKESVKKLQGKEKYKYILYYYRIHIVIFLFAVIMAASFIHGQMTKKEALLSVYVLNISLSDELRTHLTADYLSYIGNSDKKKEVALVSDLYIAKDPKGAELSTAYTSMMKLMASIEAKEADVIIAGKEAMDIMEDNGYLMNEPSIGVLSLSDFGYDEDVYIGIVANTTRFDEAKRYMDYLNPFNSSPPPADLAPDLRPL